MMRTLAAIVCFAALLQLAHAQQSIHNLPPVVTPSPTDLFPTDQVNPNSPTGYSTRSEMASQISPAPIVSPLAYGAKCDGLTDDSAAFNKAAIGLPSGGSIQLPPSPCYINSNFTLPPYVYIIGNVAEVGRVQTTNNYKAAPYSIILGATSSIFLQTDTGLRGVNIVRLGISAPLTLRQMITEVGNFAGTAIQCVPSPRSTDIDITNVMIIGFTQAMTCNSDRIKITHVKGDDTNGVVITTCADLCVLNDVMFYPYISGPSFTGPQFETTNVTGAVNNGSGAVRLSINTPATTPLVTGDTISVGNVGGVTGALGLFTITVINPTTIDLIGSTFGGAYTSGGTVMLNATYRSGTAFDLESVAGGPFLTDVEEFGWRTCIHYGGTTLDAQVYKGWCDGYGTGSGWHDPSAIALLQDGTANRNSFQGFIGGAPGYILKNTTADSYGLFTLLPGTLTGANGFADLAKPPVDIESGTLIATGADFEQSGITNYIYVGTGVTNPIKVSNSFLAGPPQFATAAQCIDYVLDGQTGPCAYTPTLAGVGTAGSQTYATRIGSYYKQGTKVTTSAQITLSALDVATSGQLLVSIPFAENSTVAGGCSSPVYTATNLSGSFIGINGTINNTESNIRLGKFDAAGSVGLVPADISNTFSITIQCIYSSS